MVFEEAQSGKGRSRQGADPGKGLHPQTRLQQKVHSHRNQYGEDRKNELPDRQSKEYRFSVVPNLGVDFQFQTIQCDSSYLLESHLSHDPVCHLDASHQDEHVEDQLPDVAPDHGGRGCVGVHRGRRRGEDGEDGAGQHDDRALHTHPGIALEEALADVLCWLSGEGGQGDRRDGRVHVQFEKAPVDAQDHDEGQHPDEQSADEGDRPEGDAGEEVRALDGRDDLLREHGLRRRADARRVQDRADDALHDAQERQHELHAIGDRGLGQGKADEQLEGMLRLLELGEAAAGAHDADDKKQDQQRVADGLHGAVDALHHAPDRSAAELLRGLGDQRPDLRQLPIPYVQGVLKVLYDPVVRHDLTPRSCSGSPS